MSSKLSTVGLSNALSIGSITFLGLFFIADSIIELWSFFESYAVSSMWTILISIPTTVLIYVIGLIVSNFSDTLFNLMYKIPIKEELSKTLQVYARGNNFMVQKYDELKLSQSFFQGCSTSLIILGIGMFATAKWIPDYKVFSYLSGGGTILTALICPFLAKKYSTQIMQIEEYCLDDQWLLIAVQIILSSKQYFSSWFGWYFKLTYPW